MKTVMLCMTVLALGFLSGCSSCQQAAPPAALEMKNSGTLNVYSVNLEQQGDATVVSGLIRQTDVTPSTVYSHVEVQVVKPDGRVVYQTRSETIAVPRHVVGRGMRHKSFQIPLNVAQGPIDPADHIVLKACGNSQCQTQPI
jgi:hypothetical protein